MQKVTERVLPGVGSAWAAAQTLAGVVLPTSGLITEMRIRANMTATLTATAVADCTRRALDGLYVGGAGKNFLGLTGNIDMGTLLSLLNWADYGVSGLGSNTDVGATSFNQSYIYHPGSRKEDRFDMSVVIPARKMVGQLQALINAPAAAVTDANGTISAGTYYIEVDHVKDVLITNRMKMPAGFCQVLHPASNMSTFPGLQVQVPIGFWLRRIAILALDQTATTPLRSDSLITGVQVTKPKVPQTLIETNWEDLKYSTCRKYGIPGDIEDGTVGAIATTRPGFNGSMHHPAGFGIIDFRDYIDPSNNPMGSVYGADLRSFTPGDVMLNLTNASFNTSQSFIIFWDLIADMDPAFIEG
jgi:hypothetical protein